MSFRLFAAAVTLTLAATAAPAGPLPAWSLSTSLTGEFAEDRGPGNQYLYGVQPNDLILFDTTGTGTTTAFRGTQTFRLSVVDAVNGDAINWGTRGSSRTGTRST